MECPNRSFHKVNDVFLVVDVVVRKAEGGLVDMDCIGNL